MTDSYISVPHELIHFYLMSIHYTHVWDMKFNAGLTKVRGKMNNALEDSSALFILPFTLVRFFEKLKVILVKNL